MKLLKALCLMALLIAAPLSAQDNASVIGPPGVKFNVDLDASAVGNWMPIANYPLIAGGIGAHYWSDSDKVFTCGGSDAAGVQQTACYFYNPVTNTYTPKAPLPMGRAYGKVVRVKNKLYYVGSIGANFAAPDGAIYEYTPSTNTWATMAPMPTGLQEGAVVVWRDSLIIHIAGSNNGFSGVVNTIRVFNPATNSWQTLTGTFPVAVMGIAGECIGNEIVIAGGVTWTPTFTNMGYRGTITPGSPISISWRSVPNVYGEAVYRSSTGVWGPKVVFGPSQDASTPPQGTTRGFSVADSTVENFTPNGPLRGNISSLNVRVKSDSIYFYVFGGYDGVANVNTSDRYAFANPNPPPSNIKNFALRLPTPGVNTNYVAVPHQPSMVGFGNNFTIEAWIRPGGTTTANTVLNKGAASFDYQLGISATTMLPFVRAQGTVVTSTAPVTAAVWTHLAATYDGTNVRFYHNGLLVSTVPGALILGSSANEMRIGRGNADAGSGNLDEIRLWSVARTQAQIDTNKCRKYPGTFIGGTTGLKALWHMDSTYIDSVSSYNGTPFGNVGFDTVSLPCVVTSITGNYGIPSEYSLSQNYPNPFNPSTTITFSIPKNEYVELHVYDVKGALVGTLVSDPYTAGTYSVEFNASKLASGVYFYKLVTNSFTEVKRMVLVK